MSSPDIFRSIQLRAPKPNFFNLSYENKLSCNFGQLIPVLCQDVIPGDELSVSTQHLIRLAPMVAPVMHRINVYMHYFYVPLRLIWDDFEDFISGGLGGRDAPISPYIDFNMTSMTNPSLYKSSSLADYLGFPVQDTSPNAGIRISQLPFRAYNLIYNEYYRDQNMLPQIQCAVPKGSGSDLGFEPIVKNSDQTGDFLTYGDPRGAVYDELMSLRYRSWQKDYFTSALPFAQRGPQTHIPISFNGTLVNDDTIASEVAAVDGPLNPSDNLAFANNSAQTEMPIVGSISRNDVNIDVTKHTRVNVITADGTINELRRSFKIQEWLEKSARGGSRYIEQIYSHFGVKGDDYRLQRPVYLGGGKSPVVISEVQQTSSSDSTTPQGNLAGNGTSLSDNFCFKRYFKEHGYVIGIMSIMPVAAYFQGMPRKYTRDDKFDYYFPSFAHLGEQAIKNQEIYWQPGNNSANQGDFGYTPRYAEYRFNNDEVHGAFRNSLDSWHLARKFANLPTLSQEFLDVNESDLYRIFAVTDPNVEHFYCQLYHKITAKRLIPKYGTPSI